MRETEALEECLTCTFNRVQAFPKPGYRDSTCESATTEVLERKQLGYLLSYLSNTFAFILKKKYYHCPIKIKNIIYRKTLKKPHKSPTLQNVGTFWHNLQYHHRIPNWERMSLWKLVLVLSLWSAVSLTLTGNHTFPREKKKEEWKERVT